MKTIWNYCFIVVKTLRMTMWVSRWGWIAPSQSSAVRNSLIWTIKASFIHYEHHIATEVTVDALGKEWKQGILTHGRVLLQLSRGILIIDQGKLEIRRPSQFAAALRMPIWVFSTRLLKNNVEKDISGMMGTVAPCLLGPKRAN